MFSNIKLNLQNLQNQPNNNIQNNQDQENKNIVSKINTNLKSFDENDPQGIIKQNLNNCLGLNFKKFNNSYSRNTQNSAPEKLYFLSHNLRTNFEKEKKEPLNLDDIISKYNAQKFQQVSNNIMAHEKDYYREFIEINGNIGINILNVVNNISSELRKINSNNPFNYMQENPDFDFNNNKMGIYMLLQQNGINGKIFDNKKKKLSTTSYKRCNEHQRRRELKKKEKNIETNQSKLKSFINISSSNNLKRKSSFASGVKSQFSMTEEQNIKNNINLNSLKQRKNYLIEEENFLFEKYFNSFVPYFKELINNKGISTNDKILKLREVLDININHFREGRKSFCEFMKRIISPLNNNNNDNKLTTKNLIERVIKFLENEFERKNYISIQSQNFHKKEDFISNYTNNIVYTYFSNVITNSQSQTIILWAKIFFYIRLGWKRECIDFINSIEGLNLNESGLREMKESLDETKPINLQNYNEFKRILNQEKKEDNPFKHACMVYITKIPNQLYNNILLEIFDHLWFNLNLINPQDNYKHLIIIKKENENEDNENILISNNDNDGKIIELIKLKNLQMFFENISPQELLNLNNKNTNFAYIILMAGLLKFKTALSFMIKNNMYVDAINFFFILQQLDLYNNFDKISEDIIISQPKKILGENNELEEIYQIFPRISNNIPALILYIIYSDSNFIQPLTYLLIETESFGVLNNYNKRMQLFQNNYENNINNQYDNSIIGNFNVCLQDLIDKNTLRKLCKEIFGFLHNHEMKNNANLNPLFNVFKDLKMLRELTGILINKSIELLELKKPIISTGLRGQIVINLRDNKNQKYFGYSLILNYFGSLINDVNQLFIEKQNEKSDLIKRNRDGSYNEQILMLEREIEENDIPLSFLKQLPIIENIYEFIFLGNFDGALKLYLENIDIFKVNFDCNEEDYMVEFGIFINEVLKKMKYGLIKLYPDILYLFVWLLKTELIDCQKKGYNNIIVNLKDKSKALELFLDKLYEMSKNDRDLMPYNSIFKMAKNEVNQIQQFYYQNNYYI